MTKREFNCPKCNKVLKDGEGERCGECEIKEEFSHIYKRYEEINERLKVIEPETNDLQRERRELSTQLVDLMGELTATKGDQP